MNVTQPQPGQKGTAELPFPIDVTALFFGVIIFSAIFVTARYILADPDTYWHITAGKWMLIQHGFLGQDVFSHSVFGKTWVNSEWLAQITLAVTYHLAGWPGLVLLCGMIISLTFVLQYSFLARELRAIGTKAAAAGA